MLNSEGPAKSADGLLTCEFMGAAQGLGQGPGKFVV